MKAWVGRICLFLAVLAMSCAPSPTATPGPDSPAPSAVPATATRLIISTPRATPTQVPKPTALEPTPAATRPPTARAHLFDDLDEEMILGAVFPGLALNLDSQGYQILNSPDWVAWVNDRDEGHLTQPQRQELVAVVANQVGTNPPKQESAYGPSTDWLVTLEARDGKPIVTHRELISPTISPLSTDVRIERTVDLAHTGQDDLLVTMNAVQSLVLRTDAHLYRWQGDKFVELWQGVEQNDNTAAVNQSDYSSYQATLSFSDLDGDGVDEIILTGKRDTYSKDADGRADLTAPSTVTLERNVYDWNGSAFALESDASTPAATLTATP